MAQYAASLSESPTTYVNSPGGHYDANSPTSSNTPFNSTSGHFSRPSPSKESDMTYVERERTWGQQDRIWITASNELPGQCPAKRRRTIVLCFDGTGDQFDGDNSNVVQFLAMLKKDNNAEQLAGIGTYTDPLFSMPVTNKVSLILDQMLAWNLASHVKDGYTFLMQNYAQGDKICIFGFSRGAYTARALAGMLQKVGLLPVSNHQQLPFAYEMYVREDEEGLQLSHMFKKTFCRIVHTEFLGVWDTVASVGLIPRYLPFIHENTGIRYLRHALALDERRVKFHPQFCVEPNKKRKFEEKHPPKEYHRKTPARAPTLVKVYEDLVNLRHSLDKPDALEVWFAGVHTDVGGGSVPNGTRHSLARIPLRWMIRECFRCNTGIIFDAVQMQRAGLRVTMDEDDHSVLSDLPPRIMVPTPEVLPRKPSPGRLYTLYKYFRTTMYYTYLFIKWFWSPKTLSGVVPVFGLDEPEKLIEQDENYEAREELEDSVCPFYDQLQARASWHILEWIPHRVKKAKAIIQKIEDGNSYKWLWNRGRGRKIPRNEMREGLKIHRSVKTRLEAAERLGEVYVPQVRPAIKRFDRLGKRIRGEPIPLTYEEWNVDNPKHWEWVD